jgi:hypothetical protein
MSEIADRIAKLALAGGAGLLVGAISLGAAVDDGR